MPKPQPPDYEHIPQATYWNLWDDYAKVALQSLLTFHGACDGAAPDSAAELAAQAADAMLVERSARIAAAKEAAEEEKAAAKPAKR